MIFKNIQSPYLRYGLLIFIAAIAALNLFLISIYVGVWGKLPDKETLSDLKYQKASEVYTADSVLIGKFFLHDRQPIQYKILPQHLIDALVSIEDKRFYEHSGIDYRSLFRVGVKTVLLQDQTSGGGSTISQQLAKNMFPRKRSNVVYLVVDKIKEMITAQRLESIYTKEEILLHYLNTVPFGDNTFGIESASLKFFNKRTQDLSVEEAATLIGMLKATYSYNPRLYPERSKKRRNLVLYSMEDFGSLSKKVRDSLLEVPIELNYRDYEYSQGIATYFREEVRRQLIRWSKDVQVKGKQLNIYTSGLKIYTTLDYNMQILAEETMVEHMRTLQKSFEKSYGANAPWLKDKKLIEKTVRSFPRFKQLINNGLTEEQAWDSINQKKTMTLSSWEGDKTDEFSTLDSLQHYMKFLNTGSLAIDPVSGAVKTWIGGINYQYFKYDHISQSKRQVGSTFKPIVYTAAIESGMDPCTYFSAEEVTYKNLEGWSPQNSGDKEETYLNYSLEEALSKSVNTIAVKVLEETGINNVITQATKMGITAKLPELPSLALGTGEISVKELAGAYAAYVNNGKPVKPFLIQTVTTDNDSLLVAFEPQLIEEPAFTEDTRLLILEMMQETINSGTASRIRTKYGLRNDIAGKTGTTQNNKDAWFVGVMPHLIHVTWVGLDSHEIGFRNTMEGQGANAALPMFALWLQKLNSDDAFASVTDAKFEMPAQEILKKLDCDPVKRDGFFKRLFKNPDKKKTKKFNSKDTGI